VSSGRGPTGGVRVRVSTCVRFVAFFLAGYSGALCAQQRSLQAPLVATSVAGSDIGDRVNHALKSCGLQCTVYIPAGDYSYSTPMELALNPFGKVQA
jgi:hypothetical protein